MKIYKWFLIVVMSLVSIHSVSAEEIDDVAVAKRIVDKKWSGFDLSDVRLLEGSYFKQMQDKHLEYLLSLDPERLLNNVLRGGDIATTAQNYGGWQHNNGNGFSNYMAGCAMLYAATGEPQLMEKIKWMIDNIADCQERENLDGFFFFGRSKGSASYNALMAATGSGTYPNNNGEDFYTNSAMAGMAFYQIHRIFYGIRDVYLYTGYEKAKDVFVKCMEWACNWTDLIPEDNQLQMALEAEHGGMVELFVDAYALTGNNRFLENAARWTHSLNFRDRMAVGDDVLTSRHANVYDPKFIGLIRDYEYTGNVLNRDAALNTWDIVVNHHVLPIGGHGRWERYGEPGKLLDELANTSAETCCTNNMLRFTKAMFAVFGDSKYLDFYERALYNHILASKDPENNSVGGGFCYYQSLMPGQGRKYMDDSSFYCCWETGLENHSKYGEAIYFHNDKDVLVNLYIPSTLNYSDKGLLLKMEGDYPEENTIKLTVVENDDFTGRIMFRCPSWMDFSKVKTTVNGVDKECFIVENRYFSIMHDWVAGDEIYVSLPVELRYEPSEEPNVVSLFYGPLVIVPNMGNASGEYISNVWNQQGDSQALTYPDFPNFDNPKSNLSSWISKTGYLTFSGRGMDKDYEFVPFYKAHRMKTSIYQRFVGADDVDWEKTYVTDRVIFNSNEDAHDYKGRSALEVNFGKNLRYVAAGNYMSFNMAVSEVANTQHYVTVKHQGWETEECGNYEVYIDDVLVGSIGNCKKLKQFTYPSFFFKVPLSLTNGKKSVRLKIVQGETSMRFYSGIEMVTERYMTEFYPETKLGSANQMSDLRLEAEAAQPHEGNRTFDGMSSSGAFVSRLSTFLQFNNVFVKTSGTYSLSIRYRGSLSLKYAITVNGNEQQLNLPAGSSSEWSLFTTQVELLEGLNIINIAPVSVRNPYDIDYIEISMVESSKPDAIMSQTSEFDVYPNPTSNTACVKTAPNREGAVFVRNISGELMMAFRYPDRALFDVSGLNNGVYLVTFESSDEIETVKLVVTE